MLDVVPYLVYYIWRTKKEVEYMEFITAKRFGEKWDISTRRVTKLCVEGQVFGASKIAGVWLIPKDSEKPYDGRVHTGKYSKAGVSKCVIEISSYIGKDTSEMKKKPTMVSLFSGCGGLDLGFEQAGFNRVWANDFDVDAQAIHRLNLGFIDGRDILSVGADEIPDCDILTAGFPCQPFSNAGKRKGVHDSRGMLYKECLRIIGAKMPKVIVFENVKGLLSTKYIDGRDLADVIKEDLSTMNRIGYNVVYGLVNASDYGVPQNRQRVLFVGIRKDLGKTFVFPEKQAKDGLTLQGVLDIDPSIPNQVDWPLSPQAMEMLEYIPEGGSWKDVPYEHLAPRFQRIRNDMKKYHSPKFYRRFGRNEICGTITASAQPENCGIIHPTKNRRFTIREVARIQTFPDDFLFIDDSLKNITAMYKVIGNAVPVRLAKVIATAIMQQVFEGEC